MKTIPLSIPNLAGNELKYITECIDTNFVSSVGKFVSEFEENFAKFLGVERAVAVVNGTAALHLSMYALGVEAGDAVLVPNLTFVAPVNAVKYLGGVPILIDSEMERLGMDPDSLREFLETKCEIVNSSCIVKETGQRVKAIIPMHTLGVSVDMEPLMELADKYGIHVIEDASESLGAKYKGVFTGGIGKCGCFSFNGNKIMTTGGGGMITTNDNALADKLKHLSTTAKTDGLNFNHDEVGFNYRMVNLLAAVGVAQLEQLPGFLKVKKENAELYSVKLMNSKMFEFYMPPENSESNFWFYSIVLKPEFLDLKGKCIDFLIDKGVVVRPIWKLMEDLPMYNSSLKSSTDNSKNLFSRIINIPCSTNLTVEEVEQVCEAIYAFEGEHEL